MELISNSLRDLQKRNQYLENENKILNSKMKLIFETNKTLIDIKNYLENTIKIISIQIGSIESMIPSNIDKELNKLRLNYEKLQSTLDRNEFQTDINEEMVNKSVECVENDVIIDSENGLNLNCSQTQTVEKSSNPIGFNQVMETEDVIPIPEPIPMIKREPELKQSNQQLICDQTNCGLKFANSLAFSVHRRTHLFKHRLRQMCPNNRCYFVTNNKDILNKHLKVCHKSIHECDGVDCYQTFANVLDLNKHKIDFHNNLKTQIISIPLDKAINQKSTKTKSSQVKKDKSGRFQCTYDNCVKSFKVKLDLIYHLRTHTNERPYKCDFDGCDKCFKTPVQLKYHINTHTGSKPYKCDGYCGQECKFASISQLSHHRKRYHSQIKQIKCDFYGFNCSETFDSHVEMQSHKKIIHFNNRPNSFAKQVMKTDKTQINNRSVIKDIEKTKSISSNVENTADLMPIRVTRRMSKSSETLNTDRCDHFACHEFRTSDQLNNENRDHSETENIFNFRQKTSTVSNAIISSVLNSNKVFESTSSSHDLDETYNTIISGENSSTTLNSSLSSIKAKRKKSSKSWYYCSQCNKEFKLISQYTIHMNRHEKPFHCPFDSCGKRFSMKEGMNIHIRTHTGEKPYICIYSECGKGFKTSGQRKQHMITHTGLKPFVCDLLQCKKDFATHSQLIHHRKRAHPHLIYEN